MNCRNCGHTLQDNQNFCGQCGKPIDSENGYHQPQIVTATDISISEEELSLFVGKKADLYLQKWRHNSRWNWPAFLFDAYWLMYRKMYLYCVLYLIIWFVWSNVIVASVFSEWNPVESPGLLPLVLFLCCIPKPVLGIFANKLYLHQAKRKITAIVQDQNKQESRETEITAVGGTNLVLPLTVLTIPYLLALLAGLLFFSKTVLMFNDALEKANVTTNKTVTNENEAPAIQPIAPEKRENSDRINILLLGGDSRNSEIQSSDSIMIVSIDPATKKVKLLSILRDTYVKIPGYGEDRISKAITMGGSSLAMRTVEEWAGIPIQYYVYMNLPGFINLTDVIGGVDIEVEKDMNYVDSNDDPTSMYQIHLKKGYQHLDGIKALQYVRFRHDALSDFARTERQRKFVKAVAKELLTTTTVMELPKLIEAIEPFIETNLNVDDMIKLGKLGFDIDTESIDSIQLPPMELIREKSVNGKAVLYVEEPEQIKSYVESILSDDSRTQSD
ncbi:LCP family protein [Paenibacillus naphthalenovorans]|uniref:Transcriptional regulator n=1 Tax=Paenibacillus naphthalenovorans TaxID=162209 RepID=A0A0U2UMP3_9BACL|nr:LCP family protein [Paenibacillus naphthalenovorans]ALS24364.1 transcriptional regulator [Paenibacillus naphthalenovorans]